MKEYKFGKIIRLIFVISLFITITISLTACGKETIDVSEYVSITSSGIDTKGTASIDKSALYKKIESVIAEKAKKDENVLSISLKVDAAYEAVKVELSESENLSNGDTITVNGSVDNDAVKKLGIEFQFKPFTYTVEGLKEVPVYTDDDIFSGVSVIFSGISPYGKAELSFDKDLLKVNQYDFSIESDYGLSNGDIIEILFTGHDTDEYLISEEASREKEVEVSGLGYYVTELSQIPNAGFQEMDERARNLIKGRFVDAETINELDFIGNYLLVSKNEYDDNKCYFVYKVNVTNKLGTFIYYSWLSINSIMIREDGTCSFDSVFHWAYSNYIPGFGYAYPGSETLETLYEECLAENGDNYTYESTIQE